MSKKYWLYLPTTRFDLVTPGDDTKHQTTNLIRIGSNYLSYYKGKLDLTKLKKYREAFRQ
jgi:hypothetical protein